MASNLSITSGSPCIGSPITVQATSAALTGTISFHRLKFVIKAGLYDTNVSGSQADTEYQTIEMSSPVTKESGRTESVEIDVSSALRAIADKYIYSATPPAKYPMVKWQVECYDEYMANGNVNQSASIYYPSSTDYLYSIFGTYNEMERVKATTGFKSSRYFSRKPSTSTEIVAVGETLLFPKPFAADKTMLQIDGNTYVESASANIAAVGLQTINGIRHKVYAVPADTTGNRFQIRFVNSMGYIESVSVMCLRSETVKSESTQYVRSVPETFGKPAGSFYKKQNAQETWEMSSGVIDEAWQDWFVHDVLMTPQAWIYINSSWLPCHLLGDEKISKTDRSKNELTAVKFNLLFDLHGPVSAATAL